jgi:type I restriction enzyme M protein
MALIVPEGFLSNTNDGAYVDVRRYLLENATLKSVTSLPRGAFEPYNRAKADILYFTNVKESRTRSHYWFFDVKNDGYTLDKKRTKTPGDNDLELVLSEKNIETQAETYLLALGISRIDLRKVQKNHYALNAAQYRESATPNAMGYPVLALREIFELSGSTRIGKDQTAPIMSITMANGLIDQADKFTKRIASADISAYRKVYRDELVVGFPIDEGVLGFQRKYDFAAVSPAYTIWRLLRHDIDLVFLELLLRSTAMRGEYRKRMQGAVDRRRSISRDVFLDILIPVPPKPVQKKIVAKHQQIEEAAKKIKTTEEEISDKLQSLFG